MPDSKSITVSRYNYELSGFEPHEMAFNSLPKTIGKLVKKCQDNGINWQLMQYPDDMEEWVLEIRHYYPEKAVNPWRSVANCVWDKDGRCTYADRLATEKERNASTNLFGSYHIWTDIPIQVFSRDFCKVTHDVQLKGI